MAEHNDFGKEAEEEATNYLKNSGYEILARNFYWQSAEIDIIAKKDNILVIIEVNQPISESPIPLSTPIRYSYWPKPPITISKSMT